MIPMECGNSRQKTICYIYIYELINLIFICIYLQSWKLGGYMYIYIQIYNGIFHDFHDKSSSFLKFEMSPWLSCWQMIYGTSSTIALLKNNFQMIPSGKFTQLLKMAIYSCFFKKEGIFHCYVSLPEGTPQSSIFEQTFSVYIYIYIYI